MEVIEIKSDNTILKQNNFNNKEEINFIIDSLETQIWFLKNIETYGKINEAHAQFIGKNIEAIEDHKYDDFLSEEEAESCRINNQKVFKEKEKTKSTEWAKNAEDEYRLLEIVRNPKLNDHGEVEYVICSAIDITENFSKQKERLNLIIEGTNIGTWEWNVQSGKIIVNETWLEMLGYTKDQNTPENYDEWKNMIHPDDLKKSQNALKRHFNGEEGLYSIELRMKHKNGSWIWVLDRGKVVNWTDTGEPLRMFGSHTEITERKKANQQVKETKELLENLADQAPGVLYQFRMFPDGSYCFPYASKGIYDIYEVEAEEIKEDVSKAFESVHPDDYDEFMKSIYDSFENMTVWHSQHRVILSDKGVRWMEGSSTPEKLEDGSVLWHGNIRDITERKKQEEKIIKLTYRDALTGLYNRRFFEEELKRLDTKRQLPISIIMADVNGLKIINDSYGHQKGDEVLKKTAEILKSSLRKEDILARQGGDEFAILLPNTDKNECNKILNRIKKESKKTLNNQIPVSIAVGMAFKNNIKENLEKIYQYADDAMYKNKLSASKSTKSRVVNNLLNTLNVKSNETKEHSVRMTKLAYDFAQYLKLSESEINRLSLLATLHDIGKINISEKILKKPGKLTDKEWETIKTHSEKGYKIASSSEEFAIIAEEIYTHHEKWDGSGYPRQLKKEDIPYLARIITIIDAFDVMTHDRPYKKAVSVEEALKEIKKCAGSQFDPELAQKFIEMLKGGENYE